MNTQENNKMIAEFMELPKVPCNIGTEDGHFTEGYKHPKIDVPIIPSGMQYKYSWEWLMPVVEKIESFQDGEDGDSMRGHLYNFRIEQHFVYILDGESMDVIIEMNGNTKREATYKAVVEFIKQHNESTD